MSVIDDYPGAYNDGYEAYEAGPSGAHQPTQCPYETGTPQAEAWNEGWFRAYDDYWESYWSDTRDLE